MSKRMKHEVFENSIFVLRGRFPGATWTREALCEELSLSKEAYNLHEREMRLEYGYPLNVNDVRGRGVQALISLEPSAEEQEMGAAWCALVAEGEIRMAEQLVNHARVQREPVALPQPRSAEAM